MKVVNKAGISIEVDEEKGLLLNGMPPTTLEALGDHWYKASCIFTRKKNPAKVSGQRKRKKALSVSVKRYKFSINFKWEK